MEIIKVFSEIDTEERLYSVLMTEEELMLFSESKEEINKQKTGKNLKTAGKIALGTGLATGIGSGIGEILIGKKLGDKVAEKTGTVFTGNGFFGKNESVDRAVNLADRSLRRNKLYKTLGKADKISAGVALAGAGALIAGKILSKKKKKKENK